MRLLGFAAFAILPASIKDLSNIYAEFAAFVYVAIRELMPSLRRTACAMPPLAAGATPLTAVDFRHMTPVTLVAVDGATRHFAALPEHIMKVMRCRRCHGWR